MDFTLTDEVAAFVARITQFVRTRIVPLESDRGNFDEHENLRLDVLERLRGEVKAAGLWAPNVAREWGGQGMSLADSAPCYEAMNESTTSGSYILPRRCRRISNASSVESRGRYGRSDVRAS